MGVRVLVIGAGMQGTAAAYDLARFGDADEVVIADADREVAERAKKRVNRLAARPVSKGVSLDARDTTAVREALDGMHACLSAAPYHLNPGLARAAVEVGVHFNDLGGHTGLVQEELALDGLAKSQGVSVVPDCGVAPGMANTLAVLGMARVGRADHVRIRCGGLPKNKDLPLGYRLLFSIRGLTNEYRGKAIVLRDGQVQELACLTEKETFELPEPIGTVEAFTTSGGSSTCPYTYAGQLKSYDYKTIRYPGHLEKIKLFESLGFMDTKPCTISGNEVVPLELFHTLMEQAWTHPDEPDLLVLQVDVFGQQEGKRIHHRSRLIDHYDPDTGFSAMERTTAFSAAIVTAFQAQGHIAPGASPLEKAVDPDAFDKALAKRQITVEHSTLG